MFIPGIDDDRKISTRRALERQSEKCSVVKKMDKVLAQGEFFDCQHALEFLEIELRSMPEAFAVRRIIKKILELGDG